MIYWYIFVGISLLTLAIFRFYKVSKRPYLRVLMYHKVSNNGYDDYLTVPINDLEEQFSYLIQEGYSPILLSELVEYFQFAKPLPLKPVLITFDDGYRDNFTLMYPLLKKYGLKANIFLVPSFIQHSQLGANNSNTDYLHIDDIQNMSGQYVEYGLHSFDHKSYKILSPRQIEEDIAMCKALLKSLNIEFQPCLAFPYGAFPKRKPAKLKDLFSTLVKNDIALAFRIGNRLNRLPLRNALLLQRLDIRGDDTFPIFKRKLSKGKSLF